MGQSAGGFHPQTLWAISGVPMAAGSYTGALALVTVLVVLTGFLPDESYGLEAGALGDPLAEAVAAPLASADVQLGKERETREAGKGANKQNEAGARKKCKCKCKKNDKECKKECKQCKRKSKRSGRNNSKCSRKCKKNDKNCKKCPPNKCRRKGKRNGRNINKCKKTCAKGDKKCLKQCKRRKKKRGGKKGTGSRTKLTSKL